MSEMVPDERAAATPSRMAAVVERGRRLGEFIRNDIGLSLTLGYVLLTVVGMVYMARFYSLFRINIFDYADAGDFLLAGAARVAYVQVVLTWISSSTRIYAKINAHRIRDGRGTMVMVDRMSAPVDSVSHTAALLGTTGRYVFLYESARQAAVIVPVSNVARITVVKATAGGPGGGGIP